MEEFPQLRENGNQTQLASLIVDDIVNGARQMVSDQSLQFLLPSDGSVTGQRERAAHWVH